MYLVAIALTLGAALESNPVPKVVGLLSALKTQLEKDGLDESKLYDTFACWCETTTTEKTAAIASATERVAELTESVKALRGTTGSTAADVAHLTKSLAGARESKVSTDAQRTKDAAAFTTRKGELETGIRNLKSAIDVLAEGTGEGAEEETELLTVAAGVRSALNLLPRAQRSSERVDQVRRFMSSPAAWAQTKASVAHVTYAPQSGAITGILKDMHDSFQRDLTKATKDESTAVTNYNALSATMTENINMLDATLTQRTGENTAAAAQLANDELDRKDTNEQLAADTEVLKTTTTTCQTRAKEWNNRLVLRSEELAGFREAISILNAGADSFANATASFVQLRVSRDPRQSSAYRELSALAARSPRLAVVAASAEMQEAGHFDGVIAMVDRMLADLKRETADDESHKAWCNTERTNAKNKEAAMQYDSDDQQAKIERFLAKKLEVETAITATKQDRDDLNVSMHAALDNRVEENTAYTKMGKETTESIKVLGEAIVALGKFAAKHALFLQEDPPPTFTGSYGGRSSESGGILAILSMIKEDMIKAGGAGHEEEAFSAAQYRKLRAQNENNMAALEREEAALEGELSHTMQVLDSTQALQRDTDASQGATQAYLVQLKPNCDWVEHTYESRKTARATEVTGLQNAKAILSGADIPTGLIATRATVEPVLSVSAELNALNAAPRTFLRH